MKQRFWIIVGCGIVLLLAAALLSLLQGPGGILATVLLVAGGAVWTAAVLFSWRQLKGYLAQRSARYGLNAFVLSFLVAVILVLVGALAGRHAWRVDLTGSREYSLSDKTQKVLQGIRKRVDIYVYFDRAARDPARDLLREYVRRNRLLRLHLEELNKDPERAERFGVSSLGTIVFDAGDKVERIGAVSEEDITNALIKVSRPGRKKVYFVTDHGEKDIANKGVAGYAAVAEALTRENYDPVTLSLTGGGTIPTDCEVLVIAGPKSGYLEHEKLAVQRYLESGRRVLFLFDPRYACGLEFYLRAWGVLVGDDRVVDPSPTGQLMGRGASTPLVNRYGVHAITRQFRQPTYFELVRSVRSWNLYNGRAERIVLAFTGEQSWAESDLISSQISFDANDMAGPVPIAVAVRLEITGLHPEDEPAISTSKPGEARVDPEALSSAGAAAANESRLVVVGDSEFANNRNFPDMGNGNLFMNCVAWLAQDEDLIAVRPKDPDLRRVALTKAQMGILNLIVLGLLPAAMAIAGVIVTVRRRRAAERNSMRFRTTWLVLALAVALGGFVWLQGRRDKSDALNRAAAARLVTGLQRDAITAVRIATGTTRIDLQQRGNGWYMIAPVPAPCDPRAITAFLDTLVAARREDDIGKEDLAKYGLDAPSATVEVDAAGRTHRLALGRINPQQTLVYLLKDDGRDVLLTTSNLLTQSVQSPFGWREKRMLNVDPDSLTRITMRTLRDGTLAVRRDPTGTWRVEAAIPWRVDPVRGRSLAFGFGRLEAIGVAAENQAELDRFGLGNRNFSAQIETANGVAGELIIGFAVGDGSYYAVVPRAPEVWRFDGEIADLMVELVRNPNDPLVFPPYDPDRITRIDVRSSDDVFSLERRSAQDWIVGRSSRVDSTFAFAPGVVTALLTDLTTIRVQEFPNRQPPPREFEKPSLVVELFAADRAVSSLEVGKRDPSGLYLWARGKDEPAAFLLSPTDLLRMPFDLERLKSEEVEAPASTDRG